MKYREALTPRFSETGPDGRLRPDALLDLLQEAAGRNAEALGLGAGVLAGQGLGWVLARERVVVEHRLPLAGEPVLVETWPRGLERNILYREFRILDEAGGVVIARATSAWVAFSLATRAALADPAPLVAAVPWDPEVAAGFPTRTVPALRSAEVEREARPRHADLDANGHVNHARLAALLLEGLPRELVDGGDGGALAELDVVFRAECGRDDRLSARGAALGGGRHRLSLLRAEDGTEVARGEALWRRPDRAGA